MGNTKKQYYNIWFLITFFFSSTTYAQSMYSFQLLPSSEVEITICDEPDPEQKITCEFKIKTIASGKKRVNFFKKMVSGYIERVLSINLNQEPIPEDSLYIFMPKTYNYFDDLLFSFKPEDAPVYPMVEGNISSEETMQLLDEVKEISFEIKNK